MELFSIITCIFFMITVAEPHTIGYGNNSNPGCTLPFYLVGDQCLLISNDVRGTWIQMRAMCQSIDGDLVSLKDANLLYYINNYIIDHGMNDTDYWVSASDSNLEGKWIWYKDGQSVSMMSPIWGRLNGAQPDGGKDQNCGAISQRDWYFMHDDECDTCYGLICQARANAGLKSTDMIPSNDKYIPVSSMHYTSECPPPYVRIGSGCFQLYFENKYSWYEAKDLCFGAHSHLAKFDDANLMTDLGEYLDGTEGFFYIGGSDESEEDTWVWLDGSFLKRGTPFWDSDGEETQEPNGETEQNCIRIYSNQTYHYRDVGCSAKFGAICQYEMQSFLHI